MILFTWRLLSQEKIIVISKNSGLKEKSRQTLKEYDLLGKIIEVRGEDVPLMVSNLIKQGKKVIGITGDDLFKEFLLENRNVNIKILKRIVWENKNFVFEKPTLCLLGPKDKELNELNKKLKICINSKYKKFAKKYCNRLEKDLGYSFEKVYASGATEEFFSNGIVDLVIDIVCSGRSAEEAGLRVYDKIFSSDIVIIGGKNEKI